LSSCKGDKQLAVLEALELISVSWFEIARAETNRSRDPKLWGDTFQRCGGYPDDVPMSEERFLRLLCAGLTNENRLDRLRSFVRRYWPNVCNMFSAAPDILDPRNWTSGTIYFWRLNLETVVKSERSATNKVNAEKRSRTKKSSKVGLDN
jgi:hypothetical protein